MEKFKIQTKEVAWAGNTPIKYQSSIECKIGDRTIRLLGEPESTEEKSLDSLSLEISTWTDALRIFNSVVF